jgi:hypothetical protein
MPDAKKEGYRRTRGAILKLLAFRHPKAADTLVVRALLSDLNIDISEEEFYSHVAYLQDKTKGYIELTEKSAGGVTIKYILITPKGLDLLDEFTPESDPGVNVNF